MDEKKIADDFDENEKPDNYEVGYGKPPKHTRFSKGVSGNPQGRRKKALDFDAALLREARTLVTINENGRKVRISKHELIAKQLTNGAMKRNSYMRMYLVAHRQASEKDALLEAERVKDLERYNDVRNLTTEELEKILSDFLAEKERGK